MKYGAFRYEWMVFFILIIPSTSIGGFLDDLKDELKKALKQPPECTKSAKPLATRQSASIPTGIMIYKGPGKRCGKIGAATTNVPITVVGEFSDWYFFNARDKNGRLVRAWVPKNSVASSQPTYSDKSRSHATANLSYPREMVAEVQQLLNDKGYNAGPVDGLYGRGTRSALTQFQRDAGLLQSGEPDDETLMMLKKVNSQRSNVSTSASVSQLENTNVERSEISTSSDLDKPGSDTNPEISERNSNTSYKARHILVKTKGEANEVINSLNEGADFIKLAKEKSTGPSALNGGNLGWFTQGQMVKPFSDATAALEKGNYTRTPVKTQFGWHVILLEDVRMKEPVANLETNNTGDKKSRTVLKEPASDSSIKTSNTNANTLESLTERLSKNNIATDKIIIKNIGCEVNYVTKKGNNISNIFIDDTIPLWDEEIANNILLYAAMKSKSLCKHGHDNIVLIIADKQHKNKKIYGAFPQAKVKATYDMRGNPKQKSYHNPYPKKHAENLAKMEREQLVVEEDIVFKNVKCKDNINSTRIFVNPEMDFTNDAYIKSLLRRGMNHGKKKCNSGEYLQARIYPKSEIEKQYPQRQLAIMVIRTSDNAYSKFENTEGERQKREIMIKAQRNLLLEFLKDSDVEDYVEAEDLVSNPFIHEKKIIVTKAYFSSMLSRHEALFGGEIVFGNVLNAFVVSKVPTTRFKEEKKMLLVGRVEGNMRYEMPSGAKVLVTNIKFVDAYEKKYKSADFDWAVNNINNKK